MDDVQRTIETVLKKERTIKTVLKEARAKRDAELAALRADLAEARADLARFEQALDAANRELAQARAERDVLRERWESEQALDALDGVLEAAVEGIDEYAVLYQGRRQEYIDAIRMDIDAVQAAQRAARGEAKQSGQQAGE